LSIDGPTNGRLQSRRGKSTPLSPACNGVTFVRISMRGRGDGGEGASRMPHAFPLTPPSPPPRSVAETANRSGAGERGAGSGIAPFSIDGPTKAGCPVGVRERTRRFPRRGVAPGQLRVVFRLRSQHRIGRQLAPANCPVQENAKGRMHPQRQRGAVARQCSMTGCSLSLLEKFGKREQVLHELLQIRALTNRNLGVNLWE
jgi:hypothetical protein